MSHNEKPSAASAEHRGGSGSPLLLLHGFSGTWRHWGPVLAGLEQHHEVFAPTLPGHCGGPAFPAGTRPSVPALVDWLEGYLDERGLDTVHIAGNSLGGWLALELARRGRARSVVALCSAGAPLRGVVGVLTIVRVVGIVYGARLLVKLPDRILRHPIARRLLLGHALAKPAAIDQELLRDLLQGSAGCSVATPLLRAIVRQGTMAALPEQPCPVAVVWGSHDRVLSLDDYGRPLQAMVPGATLTVLPNVGHVPMFDAPELATESILNQTITAATPLADEKEAL